MLQWRVSCVKFGNALCAHETVGGIDSQVRNDAGSGHVCLEVNACGLGFIVLGEVAKEMGGGLFEKEFWYVRIGGGGVK